MNEPIVKPQQEKKEEKKLYVRVPTEGPVLEKVKLVFSMFPGEEQAIIVLADTRKRYGTRCMIHEALISDLTERLGAENVVLK